MKKMKFLTLFAFIILGLIIITAHVSSAVTIFDNGENGYEIPPSALIIVGDEEIPVELEEFENEEGKIQYGISQFNLETPEFKIVMNAWLDPDPQIAYGLAVTNFLPGPQNFAFGWVVPIPPGVVPAGPTTVASSLSYSLTDFTDNGISVAPIVPGTFIQTNDVGFPITNMGVDLDNVGTSYPGGGTGVSQSYFGAANINLGPQPGPLGPWASLMVNTNFTLSGNGDIVTMNGSATIIPSPVPEPSCILLLSLGMICLVGVKKKV